MRERFSTSKKIIKEREQREIKEGIAEFLNSPRSKEGLHSELADSFEVIKTKEPLKREDFERDVRNFIDKNLETFLPIFIKPENYNVSDYIEKLGITNEQIGLLGANYYIRTINNQNKIIESYVEDYGSGERDVNVDIIDLIALAYAKENIRTDSLRESGRISGDISHRYYLESQNRYLCANDFGMKSYSHEEKRMVDGDPANASNYIRALSRQIGHISENIGTVFSETCRKIRNEEVKNKKQQMGVERLKHEEFAEIAERAEVKAMQEITTKLSTNPKDRELVLTATPARMVKNQFNFKFNRILEKFGVFSDDPIADYENFDNIANKFQKLFRAPLDQEKVDTTFDYVYFDFYKKPVILDKEFNVESLIDEAQARAREILAHRAVQNESDEVRKCFDQNSSYRSENSPYFYYSYPIYDLIKKIGAEKADTILSRNEYNIPNELYGIEILEKIGYNIEQMEIDDLKKQVYEIGKLIRSNLWNYLLTRHSDEVGDNKHQFNFFNKKQGRDLFEEGKKMYWFANQIFRKGEVGFLEYSNYKYWEQYDLSNVRVSNEKIKEYLDKYGRLIFALINQRADYDENKSEQQEISLDIIFQALENGKDLRGVALANNKQRYIEGLVKGDVENDLEFALADWPTDWRKAISQEEIDLYYEYADDYVLSDKKGLAKYAEWRAGEDWNEIFKEAPEQKLDLDFRICLNQQTEEVRSWYKEGAKYVGPAIMKSHLLRFNATRDSEGNFEDLHDALFWVDNIFKLEKADAKSIMASIETVDENREFKDFLPRYSKEDDKLVEQGPIRSLRELKKRVYAIESIIDISDLPPQVMNITSAPGFDLRTLESMSKKKGFKDLVDGKLDEEQPFRPYKRLFAGRSLTHALEEGLGSYKKKIKGTALNPKKLFNTLSDLIKERDFEGRKMQVTDLLKSIPIDLEDSIIKLLQDQKVDIGPIVEAQVHAKSDPEAWVCGNYTDCCMPFGAKNNTDYMFNPSTQYFTIKYNDRIVAQSVVVDSINRKNNEDVIILDNIEVANNYRKFTPLLANVYQTFWTEYTNLPVKIGTGYSDLIPPSGQLEENNYEPKTSLFYSDAKGSQIYDLPKMKGIEAMDKVVTFSNLSERDAELIAKIEAEVYPNEMAQGKDYIREVLQKQRELNVPGAASSFIIRQGKEVAGYLLILPEESKTNSSERVAHIYDMVVLPKFRGLTLAKKMMERVLDAASAYGVAIEAEARASTSYALLMNERIKKWLGSKGFYLTDNEKLPKYLNNEDFYFVRFENRQDAEIIE